VDVVEKGCKVNKVNMVNKVYKVNMGVKVFDIGHFRKIIR
jgi:hypothetical protein